MFRQERQEKILQFINTHKKVKAKDLAKLFNTSVVTIRSDISELDNNGLVVKVHGGAMVITDRYNLEIPSRSKARQNNTAKQMIGILAAKMVDDDDIIIIDSGSTTFEVARAIRNRRVTVITNDIQIGAMLASGNRGNMTLLITGGLVEPLTYTQCDVEALNFIKRFRVNKLFLGCDAVDPLKGISNRTLIEASVKEVMIKAAEQVIAVADSSKHNKEVFTHVCDIGAIDVLITDKMSKANYEQFKNAGVSVITPSSQENVK